MFFIFNELFNANVWALKRSNLNLRQYQTDKLDDLIQGGGTCAAGGRCTCAGEFYN